jgi:hypothetical protein
MGPFTVSCAAIGAWKESGWLKIQEARCDRCRQSVSNGAEAATAQKAQGVIADIRKDQACRQSFTAGQKSPRAGAERQPSGP